MTRFVKFHGTGNDFILIDGRHYGVRPSPGAIAAWCHRQFGIGADGLIIVAPLEGYDFEMIYFNADGSPADMCGNGARCASAFAGMLGLATKQLNFKAGDGPHTANPERVSDTTWDIEISMRDVPIPEISGETTIINTGAPHCVVQVPDVAEIDAVKEGRAIRYSPAYAADGINVDWMTISGQVLQVRTYERGVENETLSCGTGVTACAMVAGLKTGINDWVVETPGGRLSVRHRISNGLFTDVKLKGPVKLVFEGKTNLPLS